MTKVVHVAAGVVVNAQGEILIAKRAVHTHQGGLWEFPGGKLDPGESARDALRRELREELSILVTECHPLITIRHHYSDKSVLLDVWKVTAFNGEACGNEGQPIKWVAANDLTNFDFPEANKAIVSAARLPDRMAITGAAKDPQEYLYKVRQMLAREAFAKEKPLVQLRAHHCQEPDFIALTQQVSALCERLGAIMVANTSPELYQKALSQMPQIGLHLTSDRLMGLECRPAVSSWLGASCHNLEQLRKAEALALDYVTLSPVLPTNSHPDGVVLGWTAFEELTQQAKIPVFALGGMTDKHLPTSAEHGAQGIAAISAFW